MKMIEKLKEKGYECEKNGNYYIISKNEILMGFILENKEINLIKEFEKEKEEIEKIINY